MVSCKKCGSVSHVKNGVINGVINGIQRFKCKDCRCNFRNVDGRQKPQNELKKVLAVLLYSCGKTSFCRIAKLLGVSDVCVLKWIRQVANALPEHEISGSVVDVEFDELWHFVKKNQSHARLSGL